LIGTTSSYNRFAPPENSTFNKLQSFPSENQLAAAVVVDNGFSVDFVQKITYRHSTGQHASLAKPDKGIEDSNEFQEQRQAAIAEVQKSKSDSSGKVFSSTVKPGSCFVFRSDV